MPNLRKALVLVGRLGLGATLCYAAWSKLGALTQFAQDVANYRILPAAIVPFVAASLPGAEIAIGGALLLGVWTRAAAWAAASLLFLFSTALASALMRQLNLECGCFGYTGQMATWLTVGRNVMLMAVALAIAKLSQPDELSRPQP